MKKSVFYLSGVGSLQDVIRLNGKVIAKVKVMAEFNLDHPCKDEIWIDMDIHRTPDQTRLDQCLKAIFEGHHVLLHFEVEYDRLLDIVDMSSNDQLERIVSLQGELLSLKACYVDGRLMEEESSSLRAVA